MVKGKIIAAWRRSEKKDSVDFEITPFLKMPATAEKSLESAGLTYARFIGKKHVHFL